MSQKKLAENAKISEITVNRIEKAVQVPQRLSLVAIAEALGCGEADLVTDSQEASPSASAMAKVIAEQQKEIDELRSLIKGVDPAMLAKLQVLPPKQLALFRTMLQLPADPGLSAASDLKAAKSTTGQAG